MRKFPIQIITKNIGNQDKNRDSLPRRVPNYMFLGREECTSIVTKDVLGPLFLDKEIRMSNNYENIRRIARQLEALKVAEKEILWVNQRNIGCEKK
jgi:hypothetical protein